MNTDTLEVRELGPMEAYLEVGGRLPTGEIVVTPKVAARLRKLRRYEKVAVRRKMAKLSRRKNRG